MQTESQSQKSREWIQLTKHVPINFFYKKIYNKKVDHNKSGNRFNMLIDNVVIEERDEDETKVNNDEYEKIKGKGVKTNDKVNKIRKVQK